MLRFRAEVMTPTGEGVPNVVYMYLLYIIKTPSSNIKAYETRLVLIPYANPIILIL